MIGLEPEPRVEDIEIVSCFNTWGCGGFDDWVLQAGVPMLIAIVGALIMLRWRDLLLVALVATLTAAMANAALLSMYQPNASWTVSTSIVFGPIIVFEYFVLLILAALVHAPKRWIMSAFARA